MFRSLSDPWGSIGRMPLDAGCIPGGGWVATNVRVTQGSVGVGVLNRKGDDFLVRAPTASGAKSRPFFCGSIYLPPRVTLSCRTGMRTPPRRVSFSQFGSPLRMYRQPPHVRSDSGSGKCHLKATGRLLALTCYFASLPALTFFSSRVI